MSETSTREKLLAALAKPLPSDKDGLGCSDVFDPWEDVISGIHGHYSKQSDEIMLGALRAVRDRTTLDFMKENGFASEFSLYVLSGHGLTNYGTSPRGGWPDEQIADLWQPLIEKWESFTKIAWSS